MFRSIFDGEFECECPVGGVVHTDLQYGKTVAVSFLSCKSHEGISRHGRLEFIENIEY